MPTSCQATQSHREEPADSPMFFLCIIFFLLDLSVTMMFFLSSAFKRQALTICLFSVGLVDCALLFGCCCSLTMCLYLFSTLPRARGVLG
ncbi:hypothetical protein BDV97DRAFT_354093, partial [Delphinella strobiligena]